jgi:hypothetical protein
LKLSPATPAPTTGGAAVRIELDDDIGHLVHDPDIVLGVDADHMREEESVDADADFLDVDAFLVKLE